MVFREGYHGGVLTFAHGGSELNLPFPFVFADYNDIEGTRQVIGEVGNDLAAVIVEPMMGGGGCISATSRVSVHAARSDAAKPAALLIFDEVMTSRLAFRGLHGVAWDKSGFRHARQISGRRREFRRLWWACGPDGALRPQCARRILAWRYVQQQYTQHGRRFHGLYAGPHGRRPVAVSTNAATGCAQR